MSHTRATRIRRGLGPAAIACAIGATLLPGCGSATRRAGGNVVPVTERDFRISAPSATTSGDVVLQVRNNGPDQHELIVVPDRTGGLPFRSDGFTVDEEALQRAEVGSLDPGSPGAVRDLRLHLAPGRYILFCNMAGHYMGGMHAELVVKA